MFSPPAFTSSATHAIIYTNTNAYLPRIEIFDYVELKILEYICLLWSLIVVSVAAKQLKAGCCFDAFEIYSI